MASNLRPVDNVIIGGPHSGVGKTLAAEIALRTLAEHGPVGAVKLTVADGERDPSHDHGSSALALAEAAGICGRGASCGVCETVSAKVPSRLITALGAIRKPGTDTFRLDAAGAVAVAWVIALREAAPSALERAMEFLRRQGARRVLIEGTTALEWLQPRAAVMVATDPGKHWKQVALREISRCAIVLRNHLPEVRGDMPAPAALWAAHPIDCDLADARDRGTREFVRRLRALCGVSVRPSWAASEATADR